MTDVSTKPAPTPLIIYTKCSCGAHLSIECRAFSDYINASSLIDLVAAWTKQHSCRPKAPVNP